jgi:hypothetical protein
MTTRGERWTPELFRSTFDAMTAGFVGWRKSAPNVSVVSCSVWDSVGHTSAWLAAAAQDRNAATRLLKGFGVHGLKFDVTLAKSAPEELLTAAAGHPGSVVAVLPDRTIAIFPQETDI